MRSKNSNNNWPQYTNKEIKTVINIIKSGKVNFWTGNECTLFEKEFSEYFNLKYTATVANGSLALDLALQSLNLKENDEIIVTPRSYIASVSCVINSKCKPVFIDLDINSHNLDPKLIENKINKKTKAIICVHLAGFPCDLKNLQIISKKYNIFLIEDCSQAHGAKFSNKYVGSFGDIATWSFCNDKIISTLGEGGMIATKHAHLYKKILYLRDCGKNINKIKNLTNDIGYKYVHDFIGTNMRMTEIQASVGRIQLNQLSKFLTIRQKNAKIIWDGLKNIPGIETPILPHNILHACYRCLILIDKKSLKKGWNRNKIIKELKRKDIICSVGACPEIYLEKYFKLNYTFYLNRLKNAKYIGETSIAFDVNHLLKVNYFKNLCKIFKIIMLKATVN